MRTHTRAQPIDHLQVYVSSRESSYAVINAARSPAGQKPTSHRLKSDHKAPPGRYRGGDNSCGPFCGESGARVTFGDCWCVRARPFHNHSLASLLYSDNALQSIRPVLKICCSKSFGLIWNRVYTIQSPLVSKAQK